MFSSPHVNAPRMIAPLREASLGTVVRPEPFRPQATSSSLKSDSVPTANRAACTERESVSNPSKPRGHYNCHTPRGVYTRDA
jgi:hypothetical protein